MEEKRETDIIAEPQAQSVQDEHEQAATEPQSDKFLQIKYNKETLDLPLERAVSLAQKGMKYESVSHEFEELKKLAEMAGMTVPDYLSFAKQKTVDRKREEILRELDSEQKLADRIIELQNKNEENSGFEELREKFPEIKEIGELPQEVLSESSMKNRNLLDSYLRYLREKELSAIAEKKKNEQARFSSTGPLNSRGFNDADASNEQFLKGLWKR